MMISIKSDHGYITRPPLGEGKLFPPLLSAGALPLPLDDLRLSLVAPKTMIMLVMRIRMMTVNRRIRSRMVVVTVGRGGFYIFYILYIMTMCCTHHISRHLRMFPYHIFARRSLKGDQVFVSGCSSSPLWLWGRCRPSSAACQVQIYSRSKWVGKPDY